jgi:hypothetical protein
LMPFTDSPITLYPLALPFPLPLPHSPSPIT